MTFIPATRIATAERTHGKGNRHRSPQMSMPLYFLRASVVLSAAGLSRRSGGRKPQSGGIRRCRQRPPRPIASSTVGSQPLDQYTLQPHAAARETPPRAAHLLKREFSTAAPKYWPAGYSLGQGGQQATGRLAKLRQCGGQGK